MTDLWLAVDGGNSKTVAIVFDADGVVRGLARGGNTDLYGAGSVEAAVTELDRVVARACAKAGVGLGDLRHAAFRLAGIDWSDDELEWRDHFTTAMPELASFSVASDAFAPLRLAAPDGVGLSIVLGTGPAVGARTATGDWFSLGWRLREPLGAVGLGDAAMRVVYRAGVGLAQHSPFSRAVLDALGEPDADSALYSFTRRGATRSWRDLGALAPVVHGLAASGDPDALAIVDAQAALVAGYALATATRMGLDREPVPIALAGSVLADPSSPMVAAVTRELATRLPDARPLVTPGAPVHGVALDAVAESGSALDPAALAALIATPLDDAPDPLDGGRTP